MSRLKNYKLTGASDISSWGDTAFTNSGLIWNGSSWLPQQSGANITALTINDNKDWNTKGIHSLAYISSTLISGAVTTGDFSLNANTISGLIDPIWPNAAANKNYVDTISGNINSRFVASSTALSKFYPSSKIISTTPVSGETLVYKKDEERWENELPSMTFNIASVSLNSGQNINLARFDAGAKNVYVWQASASDIDGNTTGDLSIELRSGSTSVYKTSSATIQQGYPLGKSDGGDTEIRFMYSSASGYGSEVNAAVTGSAFMQISVY